MSTREPGAPGGLSERDVHYLKLLKTLKGSQQAGGGGQVGVVSRIADWIDSVAVLNFICSNAAWCDDWSVKEALLHNDKTPTRYRLELEKQVAIFDLLREMDHPDLAAEERAEIQEDVKYLFKTLPEHDRVIVKERAYALSRSRRAGASGPAVEAQPQALPAEPASAGDLAPDEALPTDGSVTEILHGAEAEAFAAEWASAMAEAQGAEAEGFELIVEPEAAPEEQEPSADAALQPAQVSPSRPVEERVAAASGSADPTVLDALVHDTSEEVQLALLANPSLSERQAATLARRAGARTAAAIYRERRLFMRPMVQAALLECPNASSSALLEIVNGISDLSKLLALIKSPKVKFLEVKAKARHRLTTIFRAMGANEKMAALRRAGRGIVKELWTDFFRDEALVLRCVKERQVDSSTVLEIARSSIAPRRVLEAIGNSPQYVANYEILLQLVLNPKTPRQVVTKLIPRLKPSDRRMVKSNPSLPESVRRLV